MFKDLEGWSEKTPNCCGFTDPSDEKIDIVHVSVDQFQPFHNLHWNQVGELAELFSSAEATELSESVVALETVVPTSLKVQ